MTPNKEALDPEVKQYIVDLEHDNAVLQESLTASRQAIEELSRDVHLLRSALQIIKEVGMENV